MSEEEILNRMAAINPAEVIFSITVRQILTLLIQRMGMQALALSQEDLKLAVEEVKAALEHSLDYRDYIQEGLDNWEVIRHL